MDKPKPENKEGMGGYCKAEPCVYTYETGKHETYQLTSEHQAGYKFWIPKCPSCGWVDTEEILRQIREKYLPDVEELTKIIGGFFIDGEGIDESEIASAISKRIGGKE